LSAGVIVIITLVVATVVLGLVILIVKLVGKGSGQVTKMGKGDTKTYEKANDKSGSASPVKVTRDL
jgi:hypothetical protein